MHNYRKPLRPIPDPGPKKFWTWIPPKKFLSSKSRFFFKYAKKRKDMWKKKIEEGPFFRFSFYRMIYIFLKSLSQELSNETFLFV